MSPLTRIVVPPSGPRGAKVFVLGEAPGRRELEQLIPFVGEAGEELWAALDRHTGLTRRDCYVTNTVPWGMPRNRTPIPVLRILESKGETRAA